MPEKSPNLSFYFDVLQTLERHQIPYVIIGGFAATIYGSNRVTDIYDMMVFHYLFAGQPELSFQEARVAAAALQISKQALEMWNLLNSAAQEAAEAE